jgi:small-conductance mechanosensitive channel
MAQLPLPTRDTTAIHVPLPSAWEQWRDAYLADVGTKLAAFLVLAALLYLVARLARRQVGGAIEDVNRRHTLRKWINGGYAVLVVLTGIALFADWLAGLGTVLALIVAGVAVALQDVLKSVVGWIYLSGRSGIQVGSRVEVGGVTGDVIDIGVLKTTMLEVGNLVLAPQASGRIVTVPNSAMLSANVFFNSAANPFVWQEIRFTVTFGSDWERAEAVLREAGEEHHAQIASDVDRGYRLMERRYAFRTGRVTPIVYVSPAPHGVELTLRFLTLVRRRRGSVDAVTRRVLQGFAEAPDVRIAYPAYRIFQEGGSGEER